jgi:hypothetical protein
MRLENSTIIDCGQQRQKARRDGVIDNCKPFYTISDSSSHVAPHIFRFGVYLGTAQDRGWLEHVMIGLRRFGLWKALRRRAVKCWPFLVTLLLSIEPDSIQMKPHGYVHRRKIVQFVFGT